MKLTEKYPVTLAERLELGPEVHRFPASWQQFLRLLELCDYPIEYEDDEIIAMSIASDLHEKIVANILGILFALYKADPTYHRYGSNRHLYLPSFTAAYSPDASVVKNEPEIFEYAVGKTANLNPWLVVEVVSPSSRERDFGVKLPRYKTIESLAYILIIEHEQPLVTLHERVPDSRRWRSQDFDQLDHTFILDGQPVTLSDIYNNIAFATARQ